METEKLKKKSGASIPLILHVGLGLPVLTDKEEDAPLGCISQIDEYTPRERPFHYSDLQ